ncbi:ABC transporter ATP-binding protein [candidate division TA06 bacterium]|uniref:ABC transporter ATP-binding protein n=1 Tax=candidate division TA06 bacterium TaxID=2250710 RepID=A0A660S9U2_UNCT6|nr:MAG: ABC transporter ATP-binding protein [candidate division TA06 bacterium]
MVIVENITKEFNGRKVLDNLSIEIRDGEIITIIGKSGIGKSVLLKSIVGLLRPEKGRIFIDDIPLVGENIYLLRRKIGFIFQKSALIESLNVGENIGLALKYIRNMPAEEIRNRVIDALRKVELDPKVMELFPSNLSGGMLKRAAIARAIILNPQYILYDEPTTGLDPIVSRTIEELIINLNRKMKITSIIVTHDLNSAVGISDRIAMLSGGKITFLGSTSDFMNSSNRDIIEFRSSYYLKTGE